MAYKEVKREDIPAPLLQAIAKDDKLRIVARAICKEWNQNNDAGELSDKAEYQRV